MNTGMVLKEAEEYAKTNFRDDNWDEYHIVEATRSPKAQILKFMLMMALQS